MSLSSTSLHVLLLVCLCTYPMWALIPLTHSSTSTRRPSPQASLVGQYRLASAVLPSGISHKMSNEDEITVSDGDSVVGSVYSTFQEITFVSSNLNKIKEVKLLLGDDFPWQLNCKSLDLPEALPVEISMAKCKRASELCEGPVIVEDTSLCFNALNGLPGPYIKWFYESIGNAGLSKMLDGFEDKTAYAQCIVSFTTGKGHAIKTFVGSCDGIIVPPQGVGNFGWDQVFKPLGYNCTFAEMSRLEKNKMSHRSKAFRQFKQFLNQRAGS